MKTCRPSHGFSLAWFKRLRLKAGSKQIDVTVRSGHSHDNNLTIVEIWERMSTGIFTGAALLWSVHQQKLILHCHTEFHCSSLRTDRFFTFTMDYTFIIFMGNNVISVFEGGNLGNVSVYGHIYHRASLLIDLTGLLVWFKMVLHSQPGQAGKAANHLTINGSFSTVMA